MGHEPHLQRHAQRRLPQHGRVLPQIRAGPLRNLRKADQGLPEDPVRRLRLRRKPLRSGDPVLHAPDLDERQFRRPVQDGHPGRNLVRLPGQHNGSPRLGIAQPPDTAQDRHRVALQRRGLRRAGLRDGPGSAGFAGKAGRQEPDRLLQAAQGPFPVRTLLQARGRRQQRALACGQHRFQRDDTFGFPDPEQAGHRTADSADSLRKTGIRL